MPPDPPAVRLRIDLAYDGSPFAGFARQTDQHTVQGALEGALSRLSGRAPADPLPTVGAGRTDRGVHAEHQVVHVDVPAGWRWLDELDRLAAVLDRVVGEAITVWSVAVAPPGFDARFSAVGRRYRYRLCDAAAMPPLWRHDTWHVGGGPVDVAAMAAAGQALVGEHDYASFCRRRDVRLPDGRVVAAPTVRRTDRVAVERADGSAGDRGLVVLAVEGAAFCHQQVRSITGTLVEVGLGRRPVGWVAEVLAARDRRAAGPVAPPQGLSLVGVDY